jgi:uncharacterized protein (DUF362 family)
MKKMNLSRRAFLRLALLGGIAGASGVVYKATEPVGPVRWFGWMWRGTMARLSMPPTRVAVVGCPSYDVDLLDRVRQAWEAARPADLSGARVVIKPNLVDHVESRPIYTHPLFIQAVIHLAREQGARDIVLAEGPAFRRDPQAILDATGVTELLEREKVPFVDLNHDDLVSVPLKGGYTKLKSLLVARTVHDADVLISIPKMKTHHWSTISISIKNLFGTVPGIKYGWPKNTLHIQGIPAFLAELTASLPTRACAIVDGILGMEGDGPLFGGPVPSGVIVAGSDLVAVDATCARLMGFDPAKIDYLNFAAWAGVGTIDESKVQVVGEPVARFRRVFEHPPGL